MRKNVRPSNLDLRSDWNLNLYRNWGLVIAVEDINIEVQQADSAERGRDIGLLLGEFYSCLPETQPCTADLGEGMNV